MPLPEALRGDKWTEITARSLFPMLVWCAENEKKITYGQVDTEIQRRGLGHHVHVVAYGHPAGAIGNALLEIEQDAGEKIPPLNALVVNAETGIPGGGCDYYLTTYLNNKTGTKLTAEQRQAMAEETMKEVWQFENWQQMLKRFGLKRLNGYIPSLLSDNTPKKGPTKAGWSSEPESEAHNLLKEWVARNPQILKNRIPFRAGHTEWRFASADEVDVMFEHKEGSLAVEVKAEISNDADLERGVYQCVKYRALLRAELKAGGKIPNGSAVLVVARKFPYSLQKLANLLTVKVLTVAPVKKPTR